MIRPTLTRTRPAASGAKQPRTTRRPQNVDAKETATSVDGSSVSGATAFSANISAATGSALQQDSGQMAADTEAGKEEAQGHAEGPQTETETVTQTQTQTRGDASACAEGQAGAGGREVQARRQGPVYVGTEARWRGVNVGKKSRASSTDGVRPGPLITVTSSISCLYTMKTPFACLVWSTCVVDRLLSGA